MSSLRLWFKAAMNQLGDAGRENQLKVPVGIKDVMKCVKKTTFCSL